MTEIALHQPALPDSVRSLASWAVEARAANDLAKGLCSTAFAPASFKGNAMEATAAILAGAELGLSPLAALNAIDIIQGRPSLKAITIRALVLSAGHDIWLVSSGPTQCVMRGKRRGSEQVQECTWTIERARDMGLTTKDQWKKQPAAMLVARATSELGRLLAPDVLLGVPYSSEEVADFGSAEPESAPSPVKRTARRAVQIQAVPEPPLESEPDAPVETITPAQMKKLHAALNDHGLTDRDLALAYMGDTIGRDVESSKTLTKDEASRVIDALESEPVITEPDAELWPDVAQPVDAS